MSRPDWHTLHSQAFQVLDLGTYNSKSRALLRIRSFTSESYKAIKERERKKKIGRSRAGSKWCDHYPHKQLGGNAEREALSTDLPADIDCNSRRACADAAHNVLSQFADPVSAASLLPEDGALGLLTPASFVEPPTSRSTSRQSDRRGETLGTRSSCDPCHQHLGFGADSADEHRIDAVDNSRNGPFVTQPLHEAHRLMIGALGLLPLPPPGCMSADRCNVEFPDQLLDDDNAPPSVTEVSEPHPGETASVADVCHVDRVLCHTDVAMINQDRRKSQRDLGCNDGHRHLRALTSQHPWTSDEDERLLHLRDVAQLTWQKIVTYFPGTAPGVARRRYCELTKRRAYHRRQLLCKQKKAVSARSLSPLSPRVKTSTQWLGLTPIARQQSPGFRRTVKHSDDSSHSPLVLSTPSEDGGLLKTSRSGRRIRRPRLHRRDEGYD